MTDRGTIVSNVPEKSQIRCRGGVRRETQHPGALW